VKKITGAGQGQKYGIFYFMRHKFSCLPEQLVAQPAWWLLGPTTELNPQFWKRAAWCPETVRDRREVGMGLSLFLTHKTVLNLPVTSGYLY